jgi:23S rRNA (cytidine1920-2'-O)/16S rRNA (cytidine1409-2'-O)-methyltransferase
MNMSKQRLDQLLVMRGLVSTRSQAESYCKLGQVKLNGNIVTKAGTMAGDNDRLEVTAEQQYVSRAALKLASVAEALRLNFEDKNVLDIGSSTGGFTQYALLNGAARVIAVDVGTNQLHPSLRTDPRILLFEQTDFRGIKKLPATPDIVLADVSFISLREILPNAHKLGGPTTQYAIMVKPQFEAGDQYKHKGVIKNDRMRRDILKDFENWVQNLFIIIDKADSAVAGTKGNRERFYLLKKSQAKS